MVRYVNSEVSRTSAARHLHFGALVFMAGCLFCFVVCGVFVPGHFPERSRASQSAPVPSGTIHADGVGGLS